MRRPRTIIAGIGLAAMAVGGVTAVSAGGSPASSAPSASTAAATARTAPAAVGRSTEAILVKAQAATASTPGSLDPTFGNGGKVLSPGGGATDAILQSNGDIVVSTGSGVARFLPTGQLDATFGSGGLASAGFVGGEGLQGVALQPDGKIIWVGSQNTPGFPAFGTFSFALNNGPFNPADPRTYPDRFSIRVGGQIEKQAERVVGELGQLHGDTL